MSSWHPLIVCLISAFPILFAQFCYGPCVFGFSSGDCDGIEVTSCGILGNNIHEVIFNAEIAGKHSQSCIYVIVPMSLLIHVLSRSVVVAIPSTALPFTFAPHKALPLQSYKPLLRELFEPCES